MLVSVITSAYNAEKTLAATINSVLQQTYNNFEYLIVDHGSNDNTSKIIDQYAEVDSRIKKITIKENLGFIGKALNIALSFAKGEYICFLDADDVYVNTFIEKMIFIVQKYNPDVAICGFLRVNDNNEVIRKDSINQDINVKDIESYKFLWKQFENNSFGYLYVWWNKFYKRKYLDENKLSFSEEYYVHSDALFNAILLNFQPKIYCINETLVKWSCVEGSLSYGNYKKGYYKEAIYVANLFCELTKKYIHDEKLKKLLIGKLLFSLPHLQRLKYYNASIIEKLQELIDWITDFKYCKMMIESDKYHQVNELSKKICNEIINNIEKEELC